MDTDVTLHVDDDNLRTIMQWMEQGRYRIPEFQRDYVWEPSDVTALFDSIYNSYPIGSLFLWEVSDNKENFFRQERDLGQPSVEETGHQISFVLDGQQRLLSLFISLHGLKFQNYDYSRILFDIDKEEFTLGKPSADHLVSVSDIWDMESRYEIKAGLDQEDERCIDKCSERLSNYKMPLLEIGSESIDSVIQIFERINQKGRDLDRFDIVNANIWSPDFNLRRRIKEDINNNLEEIGFGAVEKETVTQTLALVIDGSCTTQKQKDLNGEKVKESWTDVKESIMHSVRYIRKRHNIGRVEFLPYQGLIAVLAYYLHNSGNETVEQDHQEIIDRWFWRVIVSDHWESTRQTRMSQDAQMMDDIIEGHDVEVDYPVTITADKLTSGNIKRSKSKIRNAFLCILANKNPLHFEDGTEIDISDPLYSKFKLENHHIYPNAYLRQEDYDKDMRKSLMDITFLPSNLNKQIRDKAPHHYLKNFQGRSDFEEIMDSHLIPISNGAAIWNDNYEEFLNERAAQFMAEIKDLTGDFSGFEDEGATPMERIEKTEEIVHDLLHQRLESEHGTRYWNIMPTDISNNVEKRISESEFSGNGDREKLSYVTMRECAKVVDLYWSNFEDVFPSSSDADHHLSNLEAYKTELIDDGDVDNYTELDGDLAIQWCNSCVREHIEE